MTPIKLQPWTEQELDEALGTLAFQLAELSADCERTRQLMRRGELSSLVQPSLDSESSSAMIHHTHMPHADAGEDMGVVFDAKTDGNPLLAVDETFEWQDDDAVEQDKTARPPRPKLDRQERIRLQREQREIQTRQRAAQAARIEVISELSSVLRHRQTAKGGEPGAARPK
nr:hypothetical protein HK105_001657 [Polyrhizophydium stewartii]